MHDCVKEKVRDVVVNRCNKSSFMDPKDVRVLVIDSKSSSRQNISTLLRDCQYQVWLTL
jgi:hypothetical protein